MHTDGSGSLGTQYSIGSKGNTGFSPAEYVDIWDEELVADLVNSLRLLGAHTVEWGLTGGAAVVFAQILAEKPRMGGSRPAVLTQKRTHFAGMLEGSMPIYDLTPLSRHMVTLEDIAVPGPELLRAARPIVVDLMSPFGIPAPDQLPEGGGIDRQHFRQAGTPNVVPWPISTACLSCPESRSLQSGFSSPLLPALA
jgi:hypothetical protein